MPPRLWRRSEPRFVRPSLERRSRLNPHRPALDRGETITSQRDIGALRPVEHVERVDDRVRVETLFRQIMLLVLESRGDFDPPSRPQENRPRVVGERMQLPGNFREVELAFDAEQSHAGASLRAIYRNPVHGGLGNAGTST